MSVAPNPKKYSLASSVAYVLRGIGHYDPRMVPLLGIVALLSAAAQIIPVLLPRYIIDELSLGKAAQAFQAGNWAGASTFLALTLGFGLSLLVINVLDTIISSYTSERMNTLRMRFILRMGDKYMSTSYQNLERPQILDLAEKASKATGESWKGIGGILQCSQNLLGSLVALLFTIGIISFLQPLLLLAFACIMGTNFVLVARTRNKEKAVNDGLAPVWRSLWNLGWMLQDFQFAKDIRLFGMAPLLVERLAQQQEKRLQAQAKGWRYWLATYSFTSFMTFIQEGITYAYLIWQVLGGHIGVGEFVMYASAIRAFASNLSSVFEDADHIRFQGEYVADFRTFMDLEDDVASGGDPVPRDSVPAIEFRQVGFRYLGQETDALSDFSLVIPPGERLAVVGLNGAGKSTFVKLLTRLYEPCSGQVLLDGKPACEFDRDQYFSLFAPVFQDMNTYALSVAENVAMAQKDAIDPVRARQAIETAGLAAKVDSLSRGMEHPLGKAVDDEGVELSGGEAQKLALARALYKDAPVLVLDEPTSALDALAEERLYREFDNLSRGKTAIYVSHRLASTRFCDRIAVFEGGKVVETGTHDELLAKGGTYARLFELQARNYRESDNVDSGADLAAGTRGDPAVALVQEARS